jgi:limonene 1,2-monooxygenase
MGRPSVVDGPIEQVIDAMVDRGAWIVGTPDDCIASIKRLAEQSGGFGGFLVQTIDWAPRDKMLRSYELLARYVMPVFQGSAHGTAAANAWAYERRERLMAGRTRAIERARVDYAQRHA